MGEFTTVLEVSLAPSLDLDVPHRKSNSALISLVKAASEFLNI